MDPASSFGFAFGFTYRSPTFIAADRFGVTPNSCYFGSASSGYECSTMDFSVPPHSGLPGNVDDLLLFGFMSTDGSYSGDGRLFFQVGAFGAPGVYSNAGYPTHGGAENFADATLTVTVSAVPLPATLPVLAGGLGVLGMLVHRGRRKRRAA
jgi:hypothetical protein